MRLLLTASTLELRKVKFTPDGNGASPMRFATKGFSSLPLTLSLTLAGGIWPVGVAGGTIAAPARKSADPPRFLALVDDTSSLGLRHGGGGASPSRVIVINLRAGRPWCGISLNGPSQVTRSPSGKNFLIAVSGQAAGRPAGRILELSPLTRTVIRSVRDPVYVNNFYTSAPSWLFKSGPDGMLWLADGITLRGVRWPSMKPAVKFQASRRIGAPIFFPVAGGLLIVDASAAAKLPAIAAVAHPRMFYLSEKSSQLHQCKVPHRLRGIPYWMAVRGRSLLGMEAFGNRFMRFTLSGAGNLEKVHEKEISIGKNQNVLGFQLFGHHEGIVLGGSYGDRCWLYFLNTQTGRLIRKEKIPIRADLMYVWGRRIYLITSLCGGGEVDAAGKVVCLFRPPICIVGGVEGAQ